MADPAAGRGLAPRAGESSSREPRLRRMARGVLLLAAGLALGACAARSDVAERGWPRARLPLWVVEHGWHTGIAVRQGDVSPQLWPESRALGAFTYVEVGWGDGDYYPAPRGTLRLALRAAFASRSSALHVAAYDVPPPRQHSGARVARLDVTPRGLDALARFLHEQYARDAAGAPIPIAPGTESVSRFYLARGHYRLWSNSNHWTARALAIAGVPAVVPLAFNAGSVIVQVARMGHLVPEPH
jgi:uncharacterized protein (TIGR02117 family)